MPDATFAHSLAATPALTRVRRMAVLLVAAAALTRAAGTLAAMPTMATAHIQKSSTC